MYGLTSWEFERMDRYSLFLHKITYLMKTISICYADGKELVIESKRNSYTNLYSIGNHRNVSKKCLFDQLNDILFSDYDGRVPIVSIVTQYFFDMIDHTDEYNKLYSEFLNWSEE